MSYGKDSGEVLENAERFQRLFVNPAIEAIRQEMKSHLAPIVEANQRQDKSIEEHGTAITQLQGSQKKAMLGWGVYASVAAVALGSAWGYVKSKFHWG